MTFKQKLERQFRKPNPPQLSFKSKFVWLTDTDKDQTGYVHYWENSGCLNNTVLVES